MAQALDIIVKTDRNLPKLLTMEKQLVFASARTLTKLADIGRNLAIVKMKRVFTVRGQWYKKERKFGIKTKIASVANLESQVFTGADWLVNHETTGGADKKLTGKPGGAGFIPHHFAIPSDMPSSKPTGLILPPKRTGTGAVSKTAKPGRLRSLKRNKAFVIRPKGKAGFQLLLIRKRKRDKPALVYSMPTEVHIKEEKTITPSVQFAVTLKGQETFDQMFAEAIRTARV